MIDIEKTHPARALVEAIVATVDPSTGLSGKEIGLWIARLTIDHLVSFEDLGEAAKAIREQRSPNTWEEWQGRLIYYSESRDHGWSHEKATIGACKADLTPIMPIDGTYYKPKVAT